MIRTFSIRIIPWFGLGPACPLGPFQSWDGGGEGTTGRETAAVRAAVNWPQLVRLENSVTDLILPQTLATPAL